MTADEQPGQTGGHPGSGDRTAGTSRSDVPSGAPRSAWADVAARTALSPTRLRVLEHVESSRGPVTAVEIASALGLHHNTVREHLDALNGAGLLSTASLVTGRRGRPSILYRSTAPTPERVLDSYLTLLDAVAETLGHDEQGRRAAEEIGRRWARRSASPVRACGQDGDPSCDEERLDSLVPDLSAMGFAPERRGRELVMRACPLVTRDRLPHVLVCVMHEAFLDEVLHAGGSGCASQGSDDGRRAVLTPLGAGGCHLTLTPREDVPSRATAYT